LSELEHAPIKAWSFVSFVSEVADGSVEVEVEVEGVGAEREGMERSSSAEAESDEVPNETMSSATLFFLSFLPSYTTDRTEEQLVESSIDGSESEIGDGKLTLTREA